MSRGRLAFLPYLFSIAGAVTLGSCAATSARTARHQRQSVERALDAYAEAMKTGNYDKVSFAPGVTFLGPLTNGPIVGEDRVKSFLLKVSEGVKDVRVKRHVIDGEFACVIADLETKGGDIVPFSELFRIVNGQIVEIRPYFDPRPLIR